MWVHFLSASLRGFEDTMHFIQKLKIKNGSDADVSILDKQLHTFTYIFFFN